jgi:O-methyltransferase involved in polyketide biosynthesis
MDEKPINKITDISETLLIPLYSRALESKSENPILIDSKAIEITNELNKILARSDSQLHQNLARGKLRKRLGKKLNATLAMRTRKFDKYCISFLKENPNGIIVELGCGLSTRFPRIDNKKLIWFDLDFPEVIDIRKKFFKET